MGLQRGTRRWPIGARPLRRHRMPAAFQLLRKAHNTVINRPDRILRHARLGCHQDRQDHPITCRQRGPTTGQPSQIRHRPRRCRCNLVSPGFHLPLGPIQPAPIKHRIIRAFRDLKPRDAHLCPRGAGCSHRHQRDAQGDTKLGLRPARHPRQRITQNIRILRTNGETGPIPAKDKGKGPPLQRVHHPGNHRSANHVDGLVLPRLHQTG